LAGLALVNCRRWAPARQCSIPTTLGYIAPLHFELQALKAA
jgi:hypothetical protein